MNKELLPNTTLSHYRIVSKLGAGGMGEVWLAEDTRLDRKVALKLLPAEFTQHAERLRRFTQEAKAASALNHPNIISVYDIGECETGRFIVMELVSGRTLRSVIASDNSLQTFFALGHQMARALSAAHAAGITHRDIKPDNIMVRDDGYVKILDFGLARLLPTTSSDLEAATLAQQTTPGTVMGTLAYMSPEQASGHTVGSASDVFALGIVLYELATGRHPFKSETMIGYLHAITSQMPPSMTSLKSHLPAALDDLIMRMLEKDAKSRPTASEVAQALQEIEKYGSSNTLPLRIVADKEKATRQAEGFWIAVLPFKYAGSNADLTALAEGLSEDIVTGLSRFSYLRVIARGSTLGYSNRTTDLRTIGKELGARYVMEGSLRQAGSVLRVTVQLVDATTGAQLWAETYERTFRVEEIFALQDELVPRIVSTAADRHGVLPHTMSEVLRNRDVEDLRPYEVVLRGFGYFERVNAAEHAALRAALERAVEQAPTSDCWAMLAIMYCDEHRFGFNPLPDSLGRALAAAQRAVEAAVSNSFANEAQAQSLFFLREFNSFRNAAARAVALNPLDGATTAFMGLLMAYAGDWEHGCSLAERAMQLNPHHPGWYWSAAFWNSFRQRDYRAALTIALKFNMPGFFYHHVNLAIVYGQLGERESASKALGDLLVLKPDFALSARYELGKWLDPELVEHAIDGLCKAGLEIRDEERTSTPSAAPLASSEIRADEGFWVAVLQFKVRDADPDVSVLAEGLSEEISTGLSRFRYLSVVTSTSAARLKGETEDEGSLAAKRGTRYVLEGSIRKGGSAIRVSVQLVDTETGAQLWSETYSRDLQTSTIFAVQDDVAGRIVATVADSYGVLVHSMRATIRKKDDADLTPAEWQFQYFAYREQITPSAHAALKSRLQRVAGRNDGQSDLWACLAQIFVDEYAFGFQGDATSLDRALAAGRRAVELDRANQFALVALAQVHFFRRDLAAFGPAAERGMALNPLNTDALGILGLQIVHTGEFERGTAIVRRAMELNPNHAGWMHFAPLWNHFHKGEYEQALECANRVDVPGLFWPYLVMASACGHLGRRIEAEAAVRDLLALDPEFAAHARSNVESWHFASGLLESLLEGLRKAGLEIVDDKSSSSRFSPQTSPTNSLGSLLKSIAVLPFQNLSVDPEQEFFADGITEEILNALAQIKDLRVAGRSSSFSFKGRNEDLRSVGAKLNVTSILEGTLRRSGDRLRITAQLIDAVSGYQLWSERYDRVLEDIFNVQDEIALAVVDALKLKLFGDAKEAVVKRYTDDAEVHELFLKGRYYSYKYTAEGWTRAVEFFEKVIEKHPCHAPAYAGKAAAVGCLWFFGLSPADETVPTFRSAATKAIELDGSLAGAHLSLGMVNFFHDWEWEKAEQEFKQAILLNPKDAEALSYYAMFLGFVDRFDEAMAVARRALEVDPLSLLINMNVGWTYFSAGLANEAFDQARKMTEIEPGFFGAYWLKGATRLGNGDYEEAIEQLTKAVSLGGYPIVLADLGAAYALAGKTETAETILDQLLDIRRQSYVPAICLARVYSRLGELEKTVQWLETAYDERNGELVFLESEITSAAQGDSLNSLGNDPRVMDLLERMKLPPRDRESK